MSSHFEGTQQYEKIEALTPSAINNGEIAKILESKKVPEQITNLFKNEALPYDEITTLETLKPALYYQAGRFARAAEQVNKEEDPDNLKKNYLINKAIHCIEAGDVVDRAINTRGMVPMTDDERQSLTEMTVRLEQTMITTAHRAKIKNINPNLPYPDYQDFNHIETAVNSILNNCEIIDATKVDVAEDLKEDFGYQVKGKEVDPDLANRLNILSYDVHEKMHQAVEQRIKNNPTPTDEEVALGAYLEEIEPQVVGAVRVLNQKGYSTASSGFYGYGYQTIDGFFQLNESEIEAVTKTGALVKSFSNGYGFISFIPESDDLEFLTNKWNEIAEAIPDRGIPARPAMTAGTLDFWQEQCSIIQVEKVRIERALANKDYVDEAQRLDLISKLEQLSKL